MLLCFKGDVFPMKSIYLFIFTKGKIFLRKLWMGKIDLEFIHFNKRS